MVIDEAHYFTLFRKSFKAEKAGIEGGQNELVREALGILTVKDEVNVHLRFLAAHVLWQNLFATGTTPDIARKLIDQINSHLSADVTPRAQTVQIIDYLWKCSSGGSTDIAVDFDEYIFPLTAVDLSIVNGFINGSANVGAPMLRFILPLVLRSLRESGKRDVSDPYQHLFVLKNGLEKIAKISKNCSESGIKLILDRVSSIRLMEEIESNVVRPYWDSRFSGCAELALDCYAALTRSVQIAFGKDVAMIVSLINRYADNDLYPWYLRGKYRLLAVILEFWSPELMNLDEFLACESGLLVSISAGLAATHVAPFSSTVFKTVLHVWVKKSCEKVELVVEPLKRWVLAVGDLLLSDNRTVAASASKYWLPAVAKFVPDGCSWLLADLLERAEAAKGIADEPLMFDPDIVDALCAIETKHLDKEDRHACTPKRPNRARVIWACLLVRRQARHWQRSLPSMDDSEWPLILRHLDDDLRLAGFTLLFDSSGKYEPLSQSTYEMVSQFLFDNLIVTSSGFRRRLLTSFAIWFKASVDFFWSQCAASVNGSRHQRQEEHLIQFRHFAIDQLIVPIFDHLFPGANYQRLATALGLLESALDSLKARDQLWKYMQVESVVLGNRGFGVQLLGALRNSSDEIRCRAARLLKNYFIFPFNSNPLDTEAVQHVCSIATCLCRSPKAIDCETGAIFWQVIAEKLLLQKRCTIRLHVCLPPQHRIVPRVDVDYNNGIQAVQVLLSDLSNIIKTEFDRLQVDLHYAAAEFPLHGWALAVNTILDTFRTRGVCAGSIDRSLLIDYLDIACRVVDFMLNALGSPAEGICPSLAEMQDSIVTSGECGDNMDSEISDDASIPLDQQLVLACCWLNVAAFASVMAEIAAYFTLTNSDDQYGVINKIGNALFDAMSRTRHFGALEGCNLALSKYLRLCLCSDHTQINEIPMQLLQKAIEHVAAPKRVSVTRRAVGFPIIIETIVAAGWSMKKREYVKTAFDRLLAIAEDSSYLEIKPEDEKSDVSVVRAVHCLRLLLRSGSLDLEVLPYVTRCYRLAVHYFSHSVWSVRNAAMLILSAILWRVFGRREVKRDGDDSIYGENRMDLVEFCADFMDMWKFFCQRLQTVVSDANIIVDPKLFALLCFAQNLIVTDLNGRQELAQDVAFVVAALIDFLFRSPDARLKRVMAEVVANFVPHAQRRVLFENLLRHLTLKRGGKLTLNDKNGVWNLIIALKLKRSTIQPNEGGRKERDYEVRVSNHNPTLLCNWLKNMISRKMDKNDFTRINRARLEACAFGHGGVSMSAQCLALPIYTKLRCDGMIGAGDWFVILAEQILTFVDNRQNEMRRLAAALSFGYIRPFMIQIYETNRADIHVAAQMVMSLCDLLSDEDEIVRYAAARSTTLWNKEEQPLNPVLCLKALFDESVRYIGSPTSNMIRHKTLAASLFGLSACDVAECNMIMNGSDCCREKNFLFAQRDFNIYKEEWFHLRLYCSRLFDRTNNVQILTPVSSDPVLDELPEALEKTTYFSFDPPPDQVLPKLPELLEKMTDFEFQRQNEQTLFFISSRFLARYQLENGNRSSANGALMTLNNSLAYEKIVSLMRQIFGDRLLII